MNIANADDNYIARISEINRYTQNYLDKRYKAYGLNGFQHVYVTLVYRNPGIMQKELQDYLFLNPSNVTRTISYLEHIGYLKRVRDERDKRIWKLYPTEKAKQYYQEIVDIFDGWKKDVLFNFTEEERDNLTIYLNRMKENLLKSDEIYKEIYKNTTEKL